uniref:Uncharacterized protein n=1 Tax=Glossina austeni TaxID=7395 RepID=A0A1A9VGI4_GLOAU
MTTATEPEYEKKTFVATTRTAWEMKTAAYSLQLLEQEVKRYIPPSRPVDECFFVAYVADAIACQDFKGKHLHALPPCVFAKTNSVTDVICSAAVWCSVIRGAIL